MTDIKLAEDKLFVVESKDETAFLALQPIFKEHMMQWFDTSRPRMMHGELKSHDDKNAVFESEDGILYTFRVCSLQDYIAVVMARVNSPKMFDSDDELHAYYVKTFDGVQYA